jgi:S1-C subfamily serine protease
VDHGAYVSKSQAPNGDTLAAVIAGSPAETAGVKEGDVITKIGDQVVDTEHPLDLALASYSPGQTIDLEIVRGDETLTLSVTLGTRPNDL